LRLERALDVLVQLLVGPGCLCCVEIAATNDVAVGSVEVEGAGDVFKLAEGKELMKWMRLATAHYE
jgi:hypothetical protein